MQLLDLHVMHSIDPTTRHSIAFATKLGKVSIRALSVNFSGLISGTLVKRFGCRVTTLLGGLLSSLSLGLSSLAKNIILLT